MEAIDLESIKSFHNYTNQRTGSQRLNLVDVTSTEQQFETKQTIGDNQLSFSPEPKKRVAHFVGKNPLVTKGASAVGMTLKTKIIIGLIGLFVVAAGVTTTVLLVNKGDDHNLENNNENNSTINGNNSNTNNGNNSNTNGNGNTNNGNGNGDSGNVDVISEEEDSEDVILEEEDKELTDEVEEIVPDKENWVLHQITEKSVTTVGNDILFTGKIGSVTHATEVKMYYEGPGVRSRPTVNSGGLEAYPIYMNATSFDTFYSDLKEKVTKEALKLVTSDTSYDALNSKGQLIKKGYKKTTYLYKHVASIGNYLGDISDDEPAVIYQIYVNPSTGLVSMTGLYAPPGELIKVQIKEEDLAKIGSFTVIVGPCRGGGFFLNIPDSREYTRWPYLSNSFVINNTIGYVGNFFGGPIYIKFNKVGIPFTVRISNAVRYKHLIPGYTTKEEFDEMTSSTAPFFDIDIPDATIRLLTIKKYINDLSYENLMRSSILWGKIYTVSSSVPHGAYTSYSIVFLYDTFIPMAGASALAIIGANYCVLPPNWALGINYDSFVSVGEDRNWGFIHEYNHHWQRYGVGENQNEVTNNVINLVEYSLFTELSLYRNEYSTTYLYVSGHNRHLNPIIALTEINKFTQAPGNTESIYMPLFDAFGAELFIKSTQYHGGRTGIDLYYQAISEVFKYNFEYYYTKILMFTVDEEYLTTYTCTDCPQFIPAACLYQIGRYYIDPDSGKLKLAKTFQPYLVSKQIPTKLDFSKNIVVPNHFSFIIIIITDPPCGTLTKQSDYVYIYNIGECYESGIFDVRIRVIDDNGEIADTYERFALNFRVNTRLPETLYYIYPQNLYSNLQEVMNANFAGYEEVYMVPSYSLITATTPALIYFSAKFVIDDDDYRYIVYNVGTGSSELYMSINSNDNYEKVAYYTGDISSYSFSSTTHYEYNFSKGDIVYIKVYLFASITRRINIGLSKTDDPNKVITLSSQFAHVDNDTDYHYDSGTEYTRTYKYSHSMPIDSVTITGSDNWRAWGASNELQYCVDGLTSTYMHSASGVVYNEENPLILHLSFSKVISFNEIYMKTSKGVNYLPNSFTVEISDDNSTFTKIAEYTNIEITNTEMSYNLSEYYSTQYIKVTITKVYGENYIGINILDFREGPLIELNPDVPDYYGTIGVDTENLASYGHSYTVHEGGKIKLTHTFKDLFIKNYLIYTCELKVTYNDVSKTFSIDENTASDFEVSIKESKTQKREVTIEVISGKFNIEFFAYSNPENPHDDMDADDTTDESETEPIDINEWTLHTITDNNNDVTLVDNDVLFTGKIGGTFHCVEVKMYYEGPGVRTIPRINSGGLGVYPIYMNKTSFDRNYPDLKEKVTQEALKLVTSDTSYNALNSQGQLILNGKKKTRYLYKHVASIGNYLGDISDDEPAVIYQIYVNPTTGLLSMTGLYAPPGEVITVEIKQEDLTKIGSFTIIIGPSRPNGVIVNIPDVREYTRWPYLTNTFVISKTKGYVGSFFGGPIYIKFNKVGIPFTVRISNAIRYRHLIDGYTTKEEFERLSTSTAPFFDIDIPDASIRLLTINSYISHLTFENFRRSVDLWKKIKSVSTQIPHGAYTSYSILFLYDTFIPMAGASALAIIGANYCVLPPNWGLGLDYDSFVSVGEDRNWGFIHEYNHHWQRFGVGTTQNEVTNNVINLVEYSLFTELSINRNEYSTTYLLKSSHNKYLNPLTALTEINKFTKSPGNVMSIYLPLLHSFGQDLFIKATQYHGSNTGFNTFYESISKVYKYNFKYYYTTMLMFTVDEEYLTDFTCTECPVFLPAECIYQIGRYYIDPESGEEKLAKIFQPYLVSKQIPTKLDFSKNIVVPNLFTFIIISITDPSCGTLTKQSDYVYIYNIGECYESGIIDLTIKLTYESDEILPVNIKFALNFRVNTKMPETLYYIYPQNLYSNLQEVMDANFAGYEEVYMVPSYNLIAASTPALFYFAAKFVIDDDDYKYIVYAAGNGTSELYMSINSNDNYQKIAYFTGNANSFVFTSTTHYQYDFIKGDVVYIKAYLYANQVRKIIIGISKTDDTSAIIQLSSQFYHIDYDLNTEYHYESDDPYPKIYNNYRHSMPFDSVTITGSANWRAWDSSTELQYCVDGSTSTYAHTRGVTISNESPLILYLSFLNSIHFNQIYMSFRDTSYLPKSFTVEISDDNTIFTKIAEYTDVEITSKEMTYLLNQYYSAQYIKLTITKVGGSYFALYLLDFSSGTFTEINPDVPDYYGTITIETEKLALYGHSYTIHQGGKMKITQTFKELFIKNSFIYTCELKVTYGTTEKIISIDQNTATDFDFSIIESTIENRSVTIEVLSGKFNIELLAYS